MAEKKSGGRFFVYCGLLLILFLILVPVIFSFSGKLLRAEVLILLFLMLLSLIGFFGYQENWGEKVLFFVFLIASANLVFIWYFTRQLFMLPLFLGLVGFLMALPKRGEKPGFKTEEAQPGEAEPYSEVFAEKKEKPSTYYSPGKYVASRLSNVYHEPRCDWAKKIAEERRVWFADKKEARQKGYQKHECVR